MRRNPKLGTPEADRLIAALDNRVDPEPTPRKRSSFYPSYDFEEATDEQYDRIADEYERRIFGE